MKTVTDLIKAYLERQISQAKTPEEKFRYEQELEKTKTKR